MRLIFPNIKKSRLSIRVKYKKIFFDERELLIRNGLKRLAELGEKCFIVVEDEVVPTNTLMLKSVRECVSLLSNMIIQFKGDF